MDDKNKKGIFKNIINNIIYKQIFKKLLYYYKINIKHYINFNLNIKKIKKNIF